MIVNAKPVRRIRFWRHNCRLGNIAAFQEEQFPGIAPEASSCVLEGIKVGEVYIIDC